MKLRNKKTGEIIENACVGVFKHQSSGDCERIDTEARSLEKVLEVWEDYKPAEPLIKDEIKRKFIRDWAGINGIKVVLICQTFNAWGVKNKNDCEPEDKEYMCADLLFRGWKPKELEFGKEYTIAELCGEEE